MLIAGSINRQETRALISLFHEAFPKPQEFKVWLKGHPFLPFEQILEELNINAGSCGYIIKHDPIDKLLSFAKILIVGLSTVALEGLAMGCKVIIPVFADNMFMSPLGGFEQFYAKVYNPQELKAVVRKIMERDIPKEPYFKSVEFIREYWCLDKSLKRWEKLLK